MNYMDILPLSTADYKGFSVVLQTVGCSHGCNGCWAKDKAWHPKAQGSARFTEQVKEYLFGLCDNPYISNLVLQGGDPMYKSSVDKVIKLSKEFKERFPDKNLVMFTGYTLEQLQEDELRKPILDFVDVLVDGKFVEELKDPNLLYRGSSNQRIITLDNHIHLQ